MLCLALQVKPTRLNLIGPSGRLLFLARLAGAGVAIGLAACGIEIGEHGGQAGLAGAPCANTLGRRV